MHVLQHFQTGTYQTILFSEIPAWFCRSQLKIEFAFPDVRKLLSISFLHFNQFRKNQTGSLKRIFHLKSGKACTGQAGAKSRKPFASSILALNFSASLDVITFPLSHEAITLCTKRNRLLLNNISSPPFSPRARITGHLRSEE